MASRNSATTRDALARAVAAVEKSGLAKVKVAVSDIDGVLRGKVLHKTSSSRRSTAASASATSSSAGT